jgi:transcriptional/translational regulatory protein YebC/TACO1
MKNGGLTAANVTAALRKHNGNMAAAGRSFGVTRQAVFDFVKHHPSLRSVVTDCRESMKDDAESVLQRAVKKGEAWAVCFYLKTQAKDRGYVERQEYRRTADMSDEELLAIAGGGGPGTAAEAGDGNPALNGHAASG